MAPSPDMRITCDCGTDVPRSRPLYNEVHGMIIPRNALTTPDCWDSPPGPTGVQPGAPDVNSKRPKSTETTHRSFEGGFTGSPESDGVWAAQTQECRRRNAQVSMSRSSEERRIASVPRPKSSVESENTSLDAHRYAIGGCRTKRTHLYPREGLESPR